MGVASLVYEFFIYLVRDVIVEYRCFDHPGTVSKVARDSEVLIFLVLFREREEEVTGYSKFFEDEICPRRSYVSSYIDMV